MRSSVKSWLEPESEENPPAPPAHSDASANSDIDVRVAPNRDSDITGLCELLRQENEALIGSFAGLFVQARPPGVRPVLRPRSDF